MTVFADAALALFEDPNMGTTGLYTPVVGAAITVKVLRGANRVNAFTVGEGQGGGVMTAPFSLLASEVPVKPARDATLVVDDVSYTVESVEPAYRGLMWRLDVRPTGA